LSALTSRIMANSKHLQIYLAFSQFPILGTLTKCGLKKGLLTLCKKIQTIEVSYNTETSERKLLEGT